MFKRSFWLWSAESFCRFPWKEASSLKWLNLRDMISKENLSQLIGRNSLTTEAENREDNFVKISRFFSDKEICRADLTLKWWRQQNRCREKSDGLGFSESLKSIIHQPFYQTNLCGESLIGLMLREGYLGQQLICSTVWHMVINAMSVQHLLSQSDVLATQKPHHSDWDLTSIWTMGNEISETHLSNLSEKPCQIRQDFLIDLLSLNSRVFMSFNDKMSDIPENWRSVDRSSGLESGESKWRSVDWRLASDELSSSGDRRGTERDRTTISQPSSLCVDWIQSPQSPQHQRKSCYGWNGRIFWIGRGRMSRRTDKLAEKVLIFPLNLDQWRCNVLFEY